MGRCPVLAVVQQSHPKAVLGEIQPLVSPHLQEVPRGMFPTEQPPGSKGSPGASPPFPPTSNRAQSQDVFQCVGRCRCPNWIS